MELLFIIVVHLYLWLLRYFHCPFYKIKARYLGKVIPHNASSDIYAWSCREKKCASDCYVIRISSMFETKGFFD
jgi:Zn-finger protein